MSNFNAGASRCELRRGDADPDPATASIPGNDDQAAMAALLSFHLLVLYPGIFIRFSTRFIHSRQYSSLDDELPHCLPLCTIIYNPQELPQDEHYGNCEELLFGARRVPHTRGGGGIRAKCDDQ